MDTLVLIIAVTIVFIALFFDFSNGFHDSSNLVATMISSGALSPKGAVITAATFEFIGAYFLGTAVAKTIGKGLIETSLITISVVFAALLAAIVWNLFTWYFGMPSSSSHALIGGILGAVLIASGVEAIHWPTVETVILMLAITPITGLMAGFLFTKAIFTLFPNVMPTRVNRIFRRLQILSSIGLALSHGTNDAQKAMGAITMSLIILYQMSPETIEYFYRPSPEGEFIVPKWVIFACSTAIALGIASGGWRIIKTLGMKLYRIRPVHGFSAQSSSGSVIYLAALFGFPVSTTQVISSSVMGAGSAQRINAVRWGVVSEILLTWITTIPAAGVLGIVIYLAIKFLVDKLV
ncbi:MAG: inorganic phosphate transporter [Nitrospirota bacterium]